MFRGACYAPWSAWRSSSLRLPSCRTLSISSSSAKIASFIFRIFVPYRGHAHERAISPSVILLRTFDETAGYDEIVTLRDIPFQSFCEHHLAPIVGIGHVGYLPKGRVVGISKLARVV